MLSKKTANPFDTSANLSHFNANLVIQTHHTCFYIVDGSMLFGEIWPGKTIQLAKHNTKILACAIYLTHVADLSLNFA